MSEAEDRRRLAALGVSVDEAETARILRGIAEDRAMAQRLRQWLVGQRGEGADAGDNR